MLLILNTIIDQKARQHFNRLAAEHIFKNTRHQIVHVQNIDFVPENYSHLLLTGSELSAAAGSEYDEDIFAVIRQFIEADKAVLGICHGHQMLARFLAGDSVCRRSAQPEFGFKKMTIADDPLFAGISHPVFFESRYDQVYALPADFSVIAANDQPIVQAFRYKNKPVWGVQFHPEFNFKDGQDSLDRHFLDNPQDKKYYLNQLNSITQLNQNIRIFENFVNFIF